MCVCVCVRACVRVCVCVCVCVGGGLSKSGKRGSCILEWLLAIWAI